MLFDGQDVTFAGAAERKVGFVFQQYALFKHMTVARNVAFGLDVRKRKDRPDKAVVAKRVQDLLELVELGEMGKRFPSQLSGGQRQRVALARALALDPSVLLLDEPFGALDAAVRKSLRRELRRIHDATGVTTIFVTHDQEEALELADRVAILNLGQIEQVGDPVEVSERPASAFVAGFVGEGARFEGEVTDGLFRAGPLTARQMARLRAPPRPSCGRTSSPSPPQTTASRSRSTASSPTGRCCAWRPPSRAAGAWTRPSRATWPRNSPAANACACRSRPRTSSRHDRAQVVKR